MTKVILELVAERLHLNDVHSTLDSGVRKHINSTGCQGTNLAPALSPIAEAFVVDDLIFVNVKIGGIFLGTNVIAVGDKQ